MTRQRPGFLRFPVILLFLSDSDAVRVTYPVPDGPRLTSTDKPGALRPSAYKHSDCYSSHVRVTRLAESNGNGSSAAMRPRTARAE